MNQAVQVDEHRLGAGLAELGGHHGSDLRCAVGVLHARLDPVPLVGAHNVRNALAAIAVATELELPDAPVVKGLAEFHGVGRRFQRYGEQPTSDGGAFTLIDD